MSSLAQDRVFSNLKSSTEARYFSFTSIFNDVDLKGEVNIKTVMVGYIQETTQVISPNSKIIEPYICAYHWIAHIVQ